MAGKNFIKLILSALIFLYLNIYHAKAYIMCDDGYSTCRDDYICCKQDRGGYSCCSNTRICCYGGAICCEKEDSLKFLFEIWTNSESSINTFKNNYIINEK